jgi:zinc/manganese transport system ATP-binding protein
VTVQFDGHPALHHVTGSFANGSLTAIVGPNGAGKTTLLKAIAGLAPLASGTVTADRAAIAYLPQAHRLNDDLSLSVADVVLMGRWRRLGLHRAAGSQDHRDVAAALEAVGLGGFAARAVSTLSVGQRQRVLFARLMMSDAHILLLDEPFAAIDSATTRDLLAVVRAWHQGKRTVIAVLHDLDQVRAHFPQTLLVARQVVAWGPTDEALTSANLDIAAALSEAPAADAPWCQTAA